jgi:NADPH:quinone reductase-like Zn-dependent oxidoreductase/acyl carrier protein
LELPEQVSADAHYAALEKRGLKYGPAFRSVEALWRRDGEALGRLAQDKTMGFPGALVSPPLVDGALQLLAAAAPRSSDSCAAYVPVGLGRVEWLERGTPRWARARILCGDEESVEGCVELFDEEGRPLLRIDRVLARKLEGGARADAEFAPWLLSVKWQVDTSDVALVLGAIGSWIVLTDGSPTGQSIIQGLQERGASVLVAEPGERFEFCGGGRYVVSPHGPADFSQLLSQARMAPTGDDRLPLQGVVHLWSLRALAASADDLAAIKNVVDLGTESLLHLVQAMARTSTRDEPRLYVVTRGAYCASKDDVIRVDQAPVAGLCRTLLHEHSELRPTHIDLGVNPSDEADLATVRQLLLSAPNEDVIAVRHGTRFAARLRPTYNELCASTSAPAGEVVPHQLVARRPGILDDMRLEEVVRRPPEPNEVEIKVVAAGINFADVMKAMNLYPGAGPHPILGAECAGRIERLGAAVKQFNVGDDVLALAPGAMASYITVSAASALRKPAGLGFSQAAGFAVAFLTAEYALTHSAHLARGERVLIHSATGGVGLAAIQLAREVGAEIYATAGTEEKRALLRDMGIEYVSDSRSLGFVDDVRRWSKGYGIDVVLNSLKGRSLAAGLQLLAPFGRFIEIGRADIYGNGVLSLAPFQRSVAFFAVDLDRVCRERPQLIAQLLVGLLGRLDGGHLKPLPCQTFQMSNAVHAFSQMAKGKHVGKCVLSLDTHRAPVDEGASPSQTTLLDSVVRRPAAEAPFRARPDAAYLITGGLGSLGLEVAGWLVQKGARHLALLGRRAENEAGAEAKVQLDRLRAFGASIQTFAVDTSDRSVLFAVINHLDATFPPLRGIVHAAGVLEDGLVVKQTWARFRTVYASKIDSAWNLHALTVGRPLDFFVLFSSGSSLIGSPGQSNYGAANAFLDALAHHRASNGLPSLSINWGPWAEVGLAASATRGGRLAFRGFRSIPRSAGIAALEWLLGTPARQVGVIPVDARLWRQFYPKAAELSLIRDLIAYSEGPGNHGQVAGTFRKELEAMEPGPQRRAALEAHLEEQVVRVLRIARTRFDRTTPLKSLGFDSLMALELRNRLEVSLGARLSATMAWNYPTVADLAPFLAQNIGLELAPAGAATPNPTTSVQQSAAL